ncbi:MAG: glycoside hydrolase family 1, partial [Opitutaceae bacterium]
MAHQAHRIVRAWLESLTSGVVELDRDWTERRQPRFTFGEQCPTPSALSPASGLVAGSAYGYFLDPQGKISFVLPLEHGCDVGATDTVYLAGDFNGWQAAVGDPQWQLQPTELGGERVLLWNGEPTRFLTEPGLRFKFVTGEHQWLIPADDAPNVARDEAGNLNRVLDPTRTGWHLWQFKLSVPLDLAEPRTVTWADRAGGTTGLTRGGDVPLVPGNFFYELNTKLPLGALVRGGETVFRLFAPRARKVTLSVCLEIGQQQMAQTFLLVRHPDLPELGGGGVWELAIERNLHGWFYWYNIDGVSEGSGRFVPEQRVLDPYALATVGRDGPGIVLDHLWVGRGDRAFRTPAWHDLIISEVHVRDLVATAPVKAAPEERRGFVGLRKWVESPDFYLHDLGVNCVELQPIQEFDNA